MVIVDSDPVNRVLWGKLATLPSGLSARKVGEERSINMAALGAVAAFCPLILPDSLVKVMAKRLPAAKVAVNRLAFNEALKDARNLREHLTSAKIEEEFEI